jgi:hypothetical protein
VPQGDASHQRVSVHLDVMRLADACTSLGYQNTECDLRGVVYLEAASGGNCLFAKSADKVADEWMGLRLPCGMI